MQNKTFLGKKYPCALLLTSYEAFSNPFADIDRYWALPNKIVRKLYTLGNWKGKFCARIFIKYLILQ